MEFIGFAFEKVKIKFPSNFTLNRVISRIFVILLEHEIKYRSNK